MIISRLWDSFQANASELTRKPACNHGIQDFCQPYECDSEGFYFIESPENSSAPPHRSSHSPSVVRADHGPPNPSGNMSVHEQIIRLDNRPVWPKSSFELIESDQDYAVDLRCAKDMENTETSGLRAVGNNIDFSFLGYALKVLSTLRLADVNSTGMGILVR